MHLKYGTLSVRDCWREADTLGGRGAAKWQDELAWRDFFNTLLYHHPTMLQKAIQPALAAMRFDQNDEYLARWKAGMTGYPYVDAGIRQMLQIGWMHNRTRQIAASFLCKDLLLDWRTGAEYYMQELVDGDWASNYGGWQWVAGTAPDPNGNFRVFNPRRPAASLRPEPDLLPPLDTRTRHRRLPEADGRPRPAPAKSSSAAFKKPTARAPADGGNCRGNKAEVRFKTCHTEFIFISQERS